MPNITAETVAHTFMLGWIARFGTPSTITTDRGGQFESGLWQQLMQLLGSHRIRTTAYHPCANGMVERFHRQLKAALMASSDFPSTQWLADLPSVLLGIRTAIKEDLHCTSAELVYGTTLRLPGEFFAPTVDFSTADPLSFVTQLKSSMQRLQAIAPKPHAVQRTHVGEDLTTASHVFIRRDAVRKPLQHPYDGPFPILKRHHKYFTLDCNGRQQTVSLDRLKPAFIEHPLATPTPILPANAAQHDSATASSPQQSTVRTTRSGRRVHWPDRLTY